MKHSSEQGLTKDQLGLVSSNSNIVKGNYLNNREVNMTAQLEQGLTKDQLGLQIRSQ